MSILGGIGASCAAGEILALIKASEGEDDAERIKKIEEKCEHIKETGDEGWY